MATEDVRDIVVALRKEGQRIAALRSLARLCAFVGEFPQGTRRSDEEIARLGAELFEPPDKYTPPPTVEEMTQIELLVYVRNALPEAPEGIAATLRALRVAPEDRADVETKIALLDLLIANWHAIARSQPYFPDIIVEVSRRALRDPQWGFGLDDAEARQYLRQARPAQLRTISRLLDEGLTVDAIERVMGIKASAIRRLMRRHGVVISRSPGAIRPSPTFAGADTDRLSALSHDRGVTPKKLLELVMRGICRDHESNPERIKKFIDKMLKR
jgi:hypothetical protein